MDLHLMPGHLIRRLNQISVALFLDRMERAGIRLTPVQFSALTVIRTHPGIDQASVAGLIGYDRATLGKVVDRLETRGLVTRTVSENDRRARSLRLSPQGEALLDQATPHVEAVQPDMLIGLDQAEQEQFLALLNKIIMAGNDLSRAPLTPNRN
ncbi:MAG: MarR family winged helix-turn-helix transcriptional regulator [Ruegeria sp.]